ncbi:MAG: DUF971 domain-containing protein [Proteobacteria bacterium]|nr:DUF971 domain-containing protein [Pseudomonadota bacterium]
MHPDPAIVPQELRLNKDKTTLTVVFPTASYDLSAELLRVESPSAEVKGHGGPKKLIAGKKGITIKAVEPVGHYAVQLTFSDGHRTGIYTWAYLAELGAGKDAIWGTYLAALIDNGLTREPHA